MRCVMKVFNNIEIQETNNKEEKTSYDCKKLLSMFEECKEKCKKGSPEEKREQLEIIFQEIIKVEGLDDSKEFLEVNRLLAEVCGEYARTYYGNNFTQCKQLLLTVLEFQFTYLKVECNSLIISETSKLRDYSSLAEWVQATNNLYADPSALEQILPSTSSEVILKAIEGSSNEQKFLMATTLRWLGHAYKNIDLYDDNKEKYGSLFFSVYGTSEQILKMIEGDDKKYYHELTELYYNTSYYLHLINNPDDIKGACLNLEEVLKRDNSLNRQAQVLNMQICLYPEHNEETLKLSKSVLEVREKIMDQEKNPSFILLFLQANARCTFASIVVKLDVKEEFEKAEFEIGQACQFATKESQKGNDHTYFGGYFVTFAKLKFAQGKTDDALKMIYKAIECYDKHPDSTSNQKKAALLFKEQITKKN